MFFILYLYYNSYNENIYIIFMLIYVVFIIILKIYVIFSIILNIIYYIYF